MRALDDEVTSFPLVTHLKYTCAPEIDGPLGRWITGMSAQHTLEFSITDGYLLDPPSYTIPPNSLPHLRRLTFDHITSDGETRTVLAMLLKVAANLSFLRLRGVWSPKAEDPALIAMAALQGLQTLVVSQSDDPSKDEYGEDTGVKYWRLGVVDLAVERLAIEEPEWSETHEPNFTRQRLPRCPNLREVTYYTDERPSLADYVSFGIGPTPPATQSVSRYDLASIRQSPQLCTILMHYSPKPFPSMYNAAFVEPVISVEPSRWESEGYRGSVMRQYVNPADPEDEFWHVRSLTRSSENAEGVGQIGQQRCWQDFTLYKDRKVPRDVLERVYAAEGERWDFIQGGRSLPLAEDAWAILREWRENDKTGDWYGGDEDDVGDWEDGLKEDSEAGYSSSQDAAFENWMENGGDPGSPSIGYLGYGPKGHFPDDGSSP